MSKNSKTPMMIGFISLIVLLPCSIGFAVWAGYCLLVSQNYRSAAISALACIVCFWLFAGIRKKMLKDAGDRSDAAEEGAETGSKAVTADEAAGKEAPAAEANEKETPAVKPAESKAAISESAVSESSKSKEAIKQALKARSSDSNISWWRWSAKERTLNCLTYLSKHFDFIEVIGGHEERSGNSHDEEWESNFYLTDSKYKDFYNIDREIAEFNKYYAGWGSAMLSITDKIPSNLDEHYIRVKDHFFTMSSGDWSHYVETKHFPERNDPDINAVLALLAELQLDTPASEAEEEEFYNRCEEFLQKREVIRQRGQTP